MSAGTLTLTNNSAAVSGSGTAFTKELAAGDFIVATVGGIPYTLPVKTINSNTSLTLVSNFTGPTQSGLAWSAVPRLALNMVTAALVAQSAEALRGLNYDKQNWQQVFSAPGMITVRLPDGSSFPGPSWKYLSDNMATKTEGAVPVSQGGTGSPTADGARTSLGLVKQTSYSDSTAGSLLIVGAFGLGSKITEPMNANGSPVVGFYSLEANISGNPAGSTGCSVVHTPQNGYGSDIAVTAGGKARMFARTYVSNVAGAWLEFYSTGNTTRATDGTLKAASPIVQIFHDGGCELNSESEGCIVTRLGVGEYLVEGCMGLNADASWGGIDGGFDIPTDRNKQPRIWLDYTVNVDGSILIKTYHRVHATAPEFAQNRIGHTDIKRIFTETVTDGEPVDIPADSFVSVRVEMPVNSIWNQKQKDLQEAMEKAEHERQQNQQDA
ncbi:phage tail protein [Citrobacter braakii]|nr:phage tail protein [Citrobacter braakii]